MTFAEKTIESGRRAASILELELDRCIRTYGFSPCTATEALQNFLLRSDEIDNAAWSKTNLTITADQDTHPIIGGTIVDECLETAINAEHLVTQVYATADPTKTFTASFVVKGIGRTEFRLRVWNATSVVDSFYIDFDLTNYVVTGFINNGDAEYEKSSIIPVGNGYYRLSISGIPDVNAAASDDVRATCYVMDAGSTGYLGDITKGAYICAGQLREGSDPGIYVQTTTAIVNGMGTVDDACFNTFGTCQDTPNYQKAADPAGTDIDIDIVNVDDSIDISSASYVDVDAAYQVDQAGLISGDEYLLLVNTYLTHSSSSSLNDNYARLVDESGVELTGSEYRFEAISAAQDDNGIPYQYANWFTADPGTGDGLIQMQARQAGASGAVSVNSFRSFAINLTALGSANYVRDRNTTGIGITDAAWVVVETVVLPSTPGDYAIFACVQNDTISVSTEKLQTRIRVDATTTLIDTDQDIEDNAGSKVHSRWAVITGALGGESITLEQIAQTGLTFDCDYACLVAISLDAFDDHFVLTGDPDDPPSAAVYNALTGNFAPSDPGDYVFLGSLVEDWSASGKSGAQRLTIDIDSGGATVYSGDHIYASDQGAVTEHQKQIYPNSVVTFAEGDTFDLDLNVLPAASSGTNVLSNAMLFGFRIHIASPDPDPTLRFIDADLTRPPGIIDAYPSITGVRYGATRINPGGKFSIRGTVSISLQDFAHNDSQVDDYVQFRTWDAEDQGTFFGKLKERSKYYVGRPMRVLEGYIDDPFKLANFRTREYIIENITGPTADGRVTIQGKDVLALARDDRAKCPTASTGTVRTLVTAGATSIDVSIGDGAQYDPTTVDPHIRINDEIILVNTRAGDVLTSVTRGQGGTTAAEHAVDDSIQACKTYTDEPVIDVIQELLEDFASIPAKFIPLTDWQTEEGASLTGYDMTTIISSPTGVTKLLQEISAITLIDLWYSDVDQEIKLKLQTPFTDVDTTWTDDDNILMDTVKVKDLNAQRLSRSLIYYGMRNFAEKLTEPENFNFVYFEIEADKEGVNKYADEKIQTTFSRWFDGSNAVQVALTSQRLLQRFGITPIEISFDIDAKDVEALQTGDVYDVQTRVIQDVDGSPKTTRFQIVETKPKNVGSKYTYKSLAFFQDPTPDSLVISSNEVDYDIFVELGGPPAAVDITVTVNAAVDVDATNGNPAMTTEGMHPDSTLHLINNGDIRGYGGNGGAGKNVNLESEYEEECIEFNWRWGGSAGQAGGDALNVTIDVTIDNTSGNIWAGAGGGGGGDSYDGLQYGYGGGGGGGGIGTDTGNAGTGGVVGGDSWTCWGAAVTADGADGTAGSTGAAGTGGLKGGGSAGDGGDGGADWGDDGFVGGSGGKAGGAGGFAVRLNGNSIIWEGGNNASQVKGDVA